MNADNHHGPTRNLPHRSSLQIVLLALSALAALWSLSLWVCSIEEIEKYSGYHSGRLRLLVSSTTLGTLGGAVAASVPFLARGRWRWSLGMLALNLIVALAIDVHVSWPRTREVMAAVGDSDESRIKSYARLGVNLDGRSRWGWYLHAEGDTPLTAAVGNGDVAMVRALLAAGAKVNATNGWRDAPLHVAVASNQREIFDLLLESGANVDQLGHRGRTPLMNAVEYLRLDRFSVLLSRGADPNLGQPIFGALETEATHLVAMQLDESAIDDVIRELASHGASLDRKNGERRTPLTAAIHARKASCVRVLIECGAEIEHEDGRQETPLVTAARTGDLEAVHMLLKAGAAVNKSGTRGKTPLTAALMDGDLRVAQALLDAGADIHQEDDFGRSPVLAAITGSLLKKQSRFLEFVLARGANPARTNLRDNRHSPLGWAVDGGNVELVNILLDAGVDPNERHQDWNTPLLAAIEHGNLQIVKLLVARGADINLALHWNITPLVQAERFHRWEIAAYLREQGAKCANSP